MITTRFVLEDKSPILYVFHYEDGYWQFSGPEENLQDQDYKVIALEEIINIDPTVLEVADLPYKGKAYRETVSDEWKRLVS